MKNTIRVVDSDSQVLFECPIEESDRAYNFAREMEEMGVEVKLLSPSLPQTLVNSLGMKEEDQEQFIASVDYEIEDHEVGCCNKYEQ
ncbi:MAG: hypothetical protein Fur0010_03080 [Bdellovibrio sp.]